MEQYIGEGNEFPSRSEFMRAAVRAFLLEELEDVPFTQPKITIPSPAAELPSPKTLTPIITIDEDGREHQYKIIKK